jgi:transcriptional regulator with XRE-family HTH domain
MYPPQKKLLVGLGERLRLARLRRKLGIDVTCERAGISRMTLYRAEAGSPAVALGTLVRILSVLSLQADLELIARDDKLGRVLQDQELAPRRRARSSRRPVRDPAVQVVSGKQLWAMKRKAQARDHKLAAAGEVPPEAMLLLRPERLQGAHIEWPEASLIDD